MKTATVRFHGITALLHYDNLSNGQLAILFSGFPPGLPKTKFHPGVREIVSRGYAVLVPDYPGVRDSTGTFSPESALTAAKRCVSFVKKGSAKDLWSGETLTWKAKKVVLVGVSFGGALALVTAAKTGVQRVLAISAVTDWNMPLGETNKSLKSLASRVYPKTLKLSKQWRNFKKMNPSSHHLKLLQSKVWLVAAADDEVVPVEHSLRLREKIGCKLALLEDGGHVGLTSVPSAVYDSVFGRKWIAPKWLSWLR